MISFFVPGDPRPQGRPRAYRHGDGVGMYDDPKSKAWKATVAQVAGLQRNRWCGEGPLKVTLEIFLPWTSAKPQPNVLPWPSVKFKGMGDGDNYEKAVLDALNGICYKDDIQVCVMLRRKYYAVDRKSTGVQILIEEL
jgi:Holliday junction resolvase RusA-like endonuclease